jgi:hypothetical protein
MAVAVGHSFPSAAIWARGPDEAQTGLSAVLRRCHAAFRRDDTRSIVGADSEVTDLLSDPKNQKARARLRRTERSAADLRSARDID